MELGFEHRTNSGVCVLLPSHSLSMTDMTDSDDLLGPLPEGPVTRGPAATLLKTERRPRSADTSSEDSASTEIGAGEHRFSSNGSGVGTQEDLSLHGPCFSPDLFSPLSPTLQAKLAPGLERLSCLLPVLLPTQLSAPAAPGSRAVGPPPFGAACHPARTPAGADPQGL